MQGVSLRPALLGQALDAERMIVSEVDGSLEQIRRVFAAMLAPTGANTHALRAPGAVDPAKAFVLALRTHRYRLIYSQAEASWALYDLHRDPAERHDISEEHPAVVNRFEPAVAELLRARVLTGTAGAEPTQIDSETIETLRALGYLDWVQ